MKKINPEFHENLCFVQLKSLPLEQSIELRNCLNTADLFHLNINGIVIAECVDYNTYEYWFERQFLGYEMPYEYVI